MRIRLEWKINDFWIGCFWRRFDSGAWDVWLCLVPCLPIHISHEPKNVDSATELWGDSDAHRFQRKPEVK